MSRRAKEILKKECISRTEGGGAVIADVHLCGLRLTKEWYHEKRTALIIFQINQSGFCAASAW